MNSNIRMSILFLFALICFSIEANNTPRPVTPNSSNEAKALLNFLYSIKGEKVLSFHADLNQVENVKKITGHYPAVKGFTLNLSGDENYVIQSAIKWWNNGGILSVECNWDNLNSRLILENPKDYNWDNLFITGTIENKIIFSELDKIADYLVLLRDAKIPVLWYPMRDFHNMSVWQGQMRSSLFKRLWHTMFDYFVKERGLNNLIWIMCYNGELAVEFDPGNNYYDIVGVDNRFEKYQSDNIYKSLRLIYGKDLPIVNYGFTGDFDSYSCQSVNWSWLMLSEDYINQKDKDKLKEFYQSDVVLTLDELPSIMDYLPDFPNISELTKKDYFPLVSDSLSATICIDKNDYKVVHIVSQMLTEDIERVTDHKPEIYEVANLDELIGKVSLVIGTLGYNHVIDELVQQGLIDVSDIKGKWESFIITTIQHPNTKNNILLVIGSDRRGTAFGVTTLCESIGVSPWYWWADVTPSHKKGLFIEPGRFKQGEPSVQYRGIFINDERFGGWAKWVENTFEKETGEVGSKVYKKVFELILRLKGNYLWPAMHRGTKPFNSNPENARLADEYAIVMGSSHCEQMLRNNEGEWREHEEYGDFNYVTNRSTMIKYWEDRIKTNGKYENIYTLGLRGIHDYPMEGAKTNDERTVLMQKAINDQRDILKRNIDKPIDEIPQILCTYEEVLDAYHNGLKVPDDVTFLWCDDKQGYTRNLSNPEEKKRKGGSGIYYHLSYHGDPASWLWLSPLSPAFISTELTKAYTFGASKIWIFNVGDIKPAEKEISFVMDLAWNIDKWKPEYAHKYIERWAAKTFGTEYAEEIADMQDVYYGLMASGKDSHICFINYSEEELDERIRKFRDLSNRSFALMKHIPEFLKDAYFELVLYPIHGASMLNEYQLMSRRSMVNVSNGDSLMAIKDACKAKQTYYELNDWTNRYNRDICNGKWDNFFNWVPYHWLELKGMYLPLATPELISNNKKSPKGRFVSVADALSDDGVEIKSETDGEISMWIKAVTPVQNFSKDPTDNVFCHVILGENSFDASATVVNNVWHATQIGPMWSKVGAVNLKRGINKLRVTDVRVDARIDSIYLGFYPPFSKKSKTIIPASKYKLKRNSKEGRVTAIKQLGFSKGVIVQPFDIPSYEESKLSEAPFVEYNIELDKGMNCIEIRTLPTLHVYEGRDLRYAVSIDGRKPEIYSIHTEDFSAEWRINVLRGYSSRCINLNVKKSGKYDLKIYFMDPGIVLQDIRIF